MAQREKFSHLCNARTRFLILLVTVLSISTLTGCGSKPKPPAPTKPLRIGLMITPKGLSDQGFSDLANAGLKVCKKKFAIEGVVIEPATMQDPEASLRFFTGQQFDAIIVVGLAFQDTIRKIALERPNLKFYVIDSSILENNIRGISFREQEGSFMCGYLASRVSKTGKVGFIGGVKIPVIERFANGFKDGVRYVSSSTTVVEAYVSQKFNGFNQPDVAKNMALEMYKNGCDVIYSAAGASGLGAISAAAETKKFAIGVDMNQDSMAPGLVLTSMLKRVDRVVEEVVRNLSQGTPEKIRSSYGIAEGAIDLTDFRFTQEVIGPEIIQELNKLRDEIVQGHIVPASTTEKISD